LFFYNTSGVDQNVASALQYLQATRFFRFQAANTNCGAGPVSYDTGENTTLIFELQVF
jgi:hypothetical protein